MLIYILQILLLIIFFTTIIFLILWTVGNFINKVPFVTAPKATLKEIEKLFDTDENSVVYDLGCGDGRVLFYLASINPKAKYIGIENNLFPLILAKIKAYIKNKKNGTNIIIIKKNFFYHNFSDATHIFSYLYPNVMDELLPKLENELTLGSKLISLSFKFTGKKPNKEIDLKRGKYKLGKSIYSYQF